MPTVATSPHCPQPLTVTVNGPAKSGRTWVQLVIAAALADEGVAVTVSTDLSPKATAERKTKLSTSKLGDILPDLGHVTIIQVQAPRKS